MLLADGSIAVPSASLASGFMSVPFGSYYVAVEAVDPQATGKYVFAPGVREEFGPEAISGMTDLVEFFGAPWPPAD